MVNPPTPRGYGATSGKTTMCERTWAGLRFQVHSPSQYELLSIRDDIGQGDRVFVMFTSHGWGILYHVTTQSGSSHNIFRPFASREAAIAMIASRAA